MELTVVEEPPAPTMLADKMQINRTVCGELTHFLLVCPDCHEGQGAGHPHQRVSDLSHL